jgi:hypothetical protein
LRRLCPWFFDEAQDLLAAVWPFIAVLNVPVGGAGEGGGDAEGHDRAALGCLYAAKNAFFECFAVWYVVVCGAKKQQIVCGGSLPQ